MKSLKIVLTSLFGPFLIVALVYVGLFVLNYKKQGSGEPVNKTAESLIESAGSPLTVRGFCLQEFDKDRIYEFRVNAKEARLSKLSDKVECFDVECKVKEKDELAATLQSEHSIVQRNIKQIFLAGKVWGGIKGLQIDGSGIVYNFLTNKIYTNNPMTYSHPQFLFRAQRSVVDIQKDEIVMDGGVYTEFSQQRSAGNGGSN
jgi:hypothetical protein